MSEFDMIRRRKQGQAAKERVLNRLSNPQQTQKQSSEYDAIRNRSADRATAIDATRTEQLPSAFSRLNAKEAQSYNADKSQEAIQQQQTDLRNSDAFRRLNAKEADAYAAEKSPVNPHEQKLLDEAVYASEPPVIRQLDRGMTMFGNSKPVKLIGQLGQELYTPSASANVVMAAEQSAANLVGKLAPWLGKKLGGKISKTLATQTLVGAPLGVGNQLAKKPESTPNELLTAGAFGAGGGAILGGAGTLAKAGIQKGVQSVGRTLEGIRGNQVQAINSSIRSSLPSKIQRIQPLKAEPTNLDELVHHKGYGSATPETIAQTYNGKTWYHGTGTDKLTADTLDPFVGNHESLFGQGVYLTDNPKIADGYARNRGKRGTPTVYESNVNVNRVLDLEKPITNDVATAIDKTVKPLDYQYEQHMGESDYFTNLMKQEMSKPGATPENVITKLREEVKSFSHEAEIPTSEFVQDFQDLAINLKQAGYDGITHTGGHRTGNESHRVLILLDPQNVHGTSVGPRQVTRLDKYAPPANVSQPKIVPRMKGNTFTKLFGEQNIGITPFPSKKSNRIVTTEQQIVSNPLKSNISGAWDSVKQTGRSTYQNAVDYLSPLKTINPETYNTAMDASRANNLANTIIHDKFVDNQGNVIGDSLNDIMKNVRGLGKKFDDYLILRHAETRMARGEKVYDDALNMTPEKARQAVQTMEARYPGLKEAGDQWDNFNGNILDNAVKEGLLSKEARDAMRTENPHYASMRRQFTVGEKLAQPKFGNGGSAFSGQSAPIKSVSPTGSTRKIVSPIRSAIEHVQAWKTAELRNRTMQEIVNAIQLDPEGTKHIAEIVKKPSTSYQSLDDALRQGGSEEFLQQLDNDFKSLFKPAKSGEENIVRAMVNGIPVYIKVHNHEAVKALLGMGQDSAGYILRAFQKLSNATKRGATGLLAPMFAVKNLTADVVQGAIQSPNAIKHIAIDLPHAIISSIGDVLHIPGMKNLAEDFRRAGGEYSSLLRGDRGLNKSVSSLRKEAPLSMRGLAKGTVLAAKAPFKALEKVSDITENANRMAAYRRSLVGKERTPENVRNAINSAREATTNFSRRGAMARETEAFIPYNNAAIQSIYRLGKAFSNPKTALKTVAAIGTLIVAPKLREYALYHDDPDYQLLPARERYRNIILSKNADGTFNKQPMPPEYEAMGALVTDVLRKVIDKDPQAYKGTLDALANAYTPPWMSGMLQGYTQGGGPETSLKGAANATVFAPVQAVIGNQSFTGAPIVPQRLIGNSPSQQYDERTSKPAKWLGDKLGMSPLKADYLLRSYGGDPSRLLLPMMSDVGAGTPKNTLLKNFIVDPVFTNTLSNDFYNMKQKITQAESDNNTNSVPMPTWYNQDVANYATSQKKGGLTKTLSGLNTEKRDIQGDVKLSAKEKAQKLRDVQSQINKLYLEGITKMRDGGVPGAQKW